jgi:hypothetical protein
MKNIFTLIIFLSFGAALFAPPVVDADESANSVMVNPINVTAVDTHTVRAIAAFSDASTYFTGDLVIEGGVTYRANTDILVPSPFNPAEWDKIDVYSKLVIGDTYTVVYDDGGAGWDYSAYGAAAGLKTAGYMFQATSEGPLVGDEELTAPRVDERLKNPNYFDFYDANPVPASALPPASGGIYGGDGAIPVTGTVATVDNPLRFEGTEPVQYGTDVKLDSNKGISRDSTSGNETDKQVFGFDNTDRVRVGALQSFDLNRVAIHSGRYVPAIGGVPTWQASTTYEQAQLVQESGTIYQANAGPPFQSAGSINLANWTAVTTNANSELLVGDTGSGQYAVATNAGNRDTDFIICKKAPIGTGDPDYFKYDAEDDFGKFFALTKFGAIASQEKSIYLFNNSHKLSSGGNIFEVHFPTLANVASWSSGQYYKVGDVVQDSGDIYSATTDHVAGGTFAGDATNWTIETGTTTTLRLLTIPVGVGATEMDGTVIMLRFNDVITLEHLGGTGVANKFYNIGQQNITTAVDDVAYFMRDATNGNRWTMLDYQRADGTAVVVANTIYTGDGTITGQRVVSHTGSGITGPNSGDGLFWFDNTGQDALTLFYNSDCGQTNRMEWNESCGVHLWNMKNGNTGCVSGINQQFRMLNITDCLTCSSGNTSNFEIINGACGAMDISSQDILSLNADDPCDVSNYTNSSDINITTGDVTYTINLACMPLPCAPTYNATAGNINIIAGTAFTEKGVGTSGTINITGACNDGVFIEGAAYPPPAGGNQLESFRANDAVFPATVPAQGSSRGQHGIIAFDDASTERIVFEGVMSEDYSGGNINITLVYGHNDLILNDGNIQWGWEFERIEADVSTLDAESYLASTPPVAPTNAGANGDVVIYFTDTMTNAEADGILAGEAFRFRISRLGAAGLDNAVGDADLIRVQLSQ